MVTLSPFSDSIHLLGVGMKESKDCLFGLVDCEPPMVHEMSESQSCMLFSHGQMAIHEIRLGFISPKGKKLVNRNQVKTLLEEADARRRAYDVVLCHIQIDIGIGFCQYTCDFLVRESKMQ